MPDPVAPKMDSVRLTILDAIVASFKSMDELKPLDDPYGITFSTAELGPLADYDQRKRYSLGVVAGPEKEEFSYPYVMCWLTVNVEFRVTVNQGDDKPGVLVERLLTVVKRRLTEDRKWGNRAIDTKIVGSEIDLTTYADKSAVGVCVAEVQYRYSHLDPRNPLPDA